LIYQVYPTTNQSHDLSILKQAESLFRIRKLDEAILLLESNLPKYKEESEVAPLIKAYLLLSGILIKKYQYFGIKGCLPKSRQYIRQAIDLSKSKGNSELLAKQPWLLLSQP